jgi:hypothetical protein
MKNFIKKILREDFEWVGDIDPNIHLANQVLNKAFEFDPPAEDWDGLGLEYGKLVDYLESLGFESEYGTPRTIDGDNMAVGLYAYREIKSGELKYVYTSGIDEDDEESYYQHILGFARSESEDRGKNLQVVDAREFVNNMNPIKEDFDWASGVKFKLPDFDILDTKVPVTMTIHDYLNVKYRYNFIDIIFNDGRVIELTIEGDFNVRYEIYDSLWDLVTSQSITNPWSEEGEPKEFNQAVLEEFLREYGMEEVDSEVDEILRRVLPNDIKGIYVGTL